MIKISAQPLLKQPLNRMKISSLKTWNWIQQFQQLSIRQKIICGYALSLGIAVLGTSIGLVSGNRCLQNAKEKIELADEEIYLLSDLQGVLLEIHSHQHKIISLVEQPQKLQAEDIELLSHQAEAEAVITQLNDFSRNHAQSNLQAMLNQHRYTITRYFEKLQIIDQHLKFQKINPIKNLLLEFNKSAEVQKLTSFSHDLTNFTQIVKEVEESASEEQSQAVSMQSQIIITSILLSIAIASFLAVYTSKIITQPIQQLTNIAQQVTQEANFDLQVTVTTTDEVGSLTTSFNQLIQQVKHLLAQQQAQAHTQLLQSEKMSSLGRMLAGVAHEINNPVNFISGNLIHAQTYINDLLTLLTAYQTEVPNPPDEVEAIATEIDVDFLIQDLPKLIESMMVGADRTKEIVRGLKDFSRLDEGELQQIDIHSCIDSTLLILNNRLKKGIKVSRQYGEITPISAYKGLLYQVFMNILSNAIDALEAKLAQHQNYQPEINIITESCGNDTVIIRIADNGLGISPENKTKIFDMFFTTKPRGVGTGLGLAITYEIVVEKHQGKITCDSQLNHGTEFVIALPISHS